MNLFWAKYLFFFVLIISLQNVSALTPCDNIVNNPKGHPYKSICLAYYNYKEKNDIQNNDDETSKQVFKALFWEENNLDQSCANKFKDKDQYNFLVCEGKRISRDILEGKLKTDYQDLKWQNTKLRDIVFSFIFETRKARDSDGSQSSFFKGYTEGISKEEARNESLLILESDPQLLFSLLSTYNPSGAKTELNSQTMKKQGIDVLIHELKIEKNYESNKVLDVSNNKTLSSIIKSGKLIAPIKTGIEGKIDPSVYLQAKTPLLKAFSYGEVALVFDTSILDQLPFHASVGWPYGNFVKKGRDIDLYFIEPNEEMRTTMLFCKKNELFSCETAYNKTTDMYETNKKLIQNAEEIFNKMPKIYNKDKQKIYLTEELCERIKEKGGHDIRPDSPYPRKSITNFTGTEDLKNFISAISTRTNESNEFLFLNEIDLTKYLTKIYVSPEIADEAIPMLKKFIKENNPSLAHIPVLPSPFK